jgi:hydrogenase expression/formation protein HypE
VLVAFVDASVRDRALTLLRAHPLGVSATQIGLVVAEHPRMVALRTGLGGTRVVDMLPGDQLPRIC